jgi:hypothetical protein
MTHDPQLDRLLEGVASAPNPVKQLLDNCSDELDPNDLFAAWDLAGFLLDHRDVILCHLIGRRQ